MQTLLKTIILLIFFSNQIQAQNYTYKFDKVQKITTDKGYKNRSSISEIELFGLVKVSREGKYGWLDYKSGKPKIPVVHESINITFSKTRDTITVTKIIDGKYYGSAYNSKGELLIPWKYRSIEPWGKLWKVCNFNREYGLMNSKEEMILDFDSISLPYYFSREAKKYFAIQVVTNEKYEHIHTYGVIDFNGRIVAPFEFKASRESEIIDNIKEGILHGTSDEWDDSEKSKIKFYEIGKGWIVDQAFDKSGYFENGKVKVQLGAKIGTLYKSGRIDWEKVDEFTTRKLYAEENFEIGKVVNGYRRITQSGKFGLIDNQYNVILPPEYEGAYEKQGDYNIIGVQKNGKQGYVNLKNEEVIPIKFDKISRIENGLITLELNGLKSLVNTKGSEVISNCSRVDPPYKGTIRYKKNGLFGMLSITGESIIPAKYLTMAQHFSDDLIYAENENGKMGYLDKNNSIIIPFKFYNLGSFRKGQALAYETEDAPLRVINKKGEFTLVFGDEFSSAIVTESKDRFFVKRGEYFALCTREGKILIDFCIESISSTVGGDFKIDTKYGLGLVSSLGKVIIPPAYSKIIEADNGFYIVKRSVSNYDIYGSYTSQTKFGMYHWERGQVLGDYFYDIYQTNFGEYGFKYYEGGETSYAKLDNWNDNPMYKFVHKNGKNVTTMLKTKYKDKGIKIINNTDHSFKIYSRREGQTGADDAKEHSLPMGSTITLDCHATANVYGVVSYGNVNSAKLLLDVSRGGYMCDHVILMSEHLNKLGTGLNNLHFIELKD